jgi:uncharacterized protein (AIM24 family)
MKSSLFGAHLETATTGERFALQNERLLRVTLGPEVMARQGAMVAYQGGVQFEFQGSGGVGRFLKKALTGEGLPLMRCFGAGELFLARDAREIFLIQLEGESLTVNGDNLLAFDATIEWDIRRVEGVSMLAGGVFNTVLSGTGWVAVSSFGTPVVLQTDVPTFADIQSAICWSSDLQTSVQRTMKLGALVGRGSGEAVQLAFSGQGFVVVQASEGPSVPPHNHGS